MNITSGAFSLANNTKTRPIVPLRSILPATSFVQFEAKRLSAPSLVWASDSRAADTLLRDYAYCNPCPGDPEHAFLPETKVFDGERYGGGFIMSNGGGVRCGEANGISIKGIGQNALVGSTTDFFHSYGGAAINEGIVEAIWGELSNIALPFGGIRVLALIDTGTRVPLLGARSGRDPTTNRALIVRQAPPRPAHFMRAVFYRPNELMKRSVSDTTRTRAAIESIGQVFEALYQGAPGDKLDPHYLNECLRETFHRYAAQIAAGRAKRIMHSGINEANLTLDGSWLDFATATTVSDYGRIDSMPHSVDFTREGVNLNSVVADLLFYMRKYLPDNRGAAILSSQELSSHFQKSLRERLRVEFLKLLGASEARNRQIAPGIMQPLYATMCEIRDAGNEGLHAIWSDNPQDPLVMPEKTGDYHLNTILGDLALCASPAQANEVLRPGLPVDSLRGALVDRYWRFRVAYLSHFPQSARRNAQLFLALNSQRVNRRHPELYRPELYGAVERVVLDGAEIGAFIDGVVHRARTAFSEIENQSVDISAWFDRSATLSEQEGVMFDGTPVSIQNAIREMRPNVLDERQENMLINLLEMA